jgi:phosphocarrier protein FPr
MVSIVLVSHSRALAEALEHLTQQVSSAQLAIAIAGGVGENHRELGTNALDIAEAIKSVYTPRGVLVLMDLGSAILSAEMALELLPVEWREHIRFCPAPIVEGAISAAIQASLGSDLATVYAEALTSLQPKQEQLQTEPATRQTPTQNLAPEYQITLTLRNKHGLHARPAARFVQTAARYNAQISVSNLTNGRGPASARSLNAIAALVALKNHTIRIQASGAQAQQALQALQNLVDDNFGEVDSTPEAPAAPQTPSASPQETNGGLQVLPISEGFACAPKATYQPPTPQIPTHPAEDPAVEWHRLQTACAQVAAQIETRRRQMNRTLGAEQAAIFDAHLLILNDPEMQAHASRAIFEQHQNAALAWYTATQNAAQTYRTLEDEYLRQRAADVLDVAVQVLLQLLGVSPQKLHFDTPVILIADELTPTQTAQLDLNNIHGIATVSGGPTSHSAILARSLGIPAVSGIPAEMLRSGSETLALDGTRGILWRNPDTEQQEKIQQQRAQWLAQRAEQLQSSHQPAQTIDGHQIEIVANIGSVADARTALKYGAEGVGLLRTEFLFLTRNDAPTEDEQTETLLQIGAALQGKPIIVRTLDVGGDKPLPYVSMPPEANPFLGVRAIRLSQQRPDLFQTQIRAILRAAAEYPFRVMFPMVADAAEIKWARIQMEDAHQALQAAGIPHAERIETGIMVEIPSAALIAQHLAREVDFFSIGTNDLTQYTLAAERGSPALANLADALHPAVLRLIKSVIEGAHRYGKWVGVCGELAGDPLAVPVLLGMGVDELSLNAAGIPRVKEIIRNMRYTAAQGLAAECLRAANAQECRAAADKFAKRDKDKR